jgi:hypothetical protein
MRETRIAGKAAPTNSFDAGMFDGPLCALPCVVGVLVDALREHHQGRLLQVGGHRRHLAPKPPP